MAIAWGLALALRSDEALQLAAEIEHDIATTELPESDLLRDCQAIRAVAIAIMDDSERALPLAQECVNKSRDPWTANVASNVLRFSHMKAGDLKQFYATPWIPFSQEEDRQERICVGVSALPSRARRGAAAPSRRGAGLLSRGLADFRTARRAELGRGGFAGKSDCAHTVRAGRPRRGGGIGYRSRTADQRGDDAGLRVERIFRHVQGGRRADELRAGSHDPGASRKPGCGPRLGTVGDGRHSRTSAALLA